MVRTGEVSSMMTEEGKRGGVGHWGAHRRPKGDNGHQGECHKRTIDRQWDQDIEESRPGSFRLKSWDLKGYPLIRAGTDGPDLTRYFVVGVGTPAECR